MTIEVADLLMRKKRLLCLVGGDSWLRQRLCDSTVGKTSEGEKEGEQQRHERCIH